MSFRIHSFLLRRSSLWCAMLLVLFSIGAQAADITVRSSVSRGTTSLGEPVQFQIKISGGAQRMTGPPEVAADGLEIRYLGPSQNAVVRFQNGSFVSERTTTLVYQVTPQRNGTFTIPAVEVELDGKKYRTEPVGLTVQKSSDGQEDQTSLGFAEFVIAKKTAYLGEAIPLELRLYVDSRVHWQPVTMPEISGEGFTKQKLPEPQADKVQRNGRDYDLLVFKTAIMPSRAGKITVGPSEIVYNARIPRARKGGPRSLFDMLDDDIMGDPFYSQVQQVKTKADALEITVKPLPIVGRPADFSGAVGLFQLSTDGNPKQVKTGDPVNLTMKISGKGNFDRVAAPTLKDTDGWRTYPPSNSFKGEDDLGISGVKSFEMAVIPETKKTEMPVVQFSYFDPLKEKYVTLTSERAPLSVEGVIPQAAPLPPTVTSKTADQPPAAQPPPPRAPNDILGLRYEADAGPGLVPLYELREFWVAQGAAALVLCGLVGVRLHRRPDAAVLALAALRREREKDLGRLRSTKVDDREFLETATRVARIETALATGQPVGSIDANGVRTSARVEPGTAEVLDQVFAAHAELLYAGDDRTAAPANLPDRNRVLAALEELRKGYARS